MIKNLITYYDNYAVIHCKSKEKRFEVKVDIEDVNKIIQNGYTVTMRHTKHNNEYRPELATKNKKHNYLYRFILGVTKPESIVDHINHNVLDNRRCNLRITNKSINEQNRSGANKNNKCGFRNVYFVKNYKKWCVNFCINKKTVVFGYYDTLKEAVKVADAKRKEVFCNA